MSKKILLVEDDKMLTEMYSLKFAEFGYKVTQANSGLSGYKLAIKTKPDIIMLDIILPEMDGFSVLKKLKSNKATENIPVFFLTNLKQEEDVIRGKKEGAVDYLVKADLTPAQVLEKINKFLKK
ncbi:response regulator [Candidatus Parcubacteria bacterium]|nr:response regulator [Candidatus Parcubacteria bacterium]